MSKINALLNRIDELNNKIEDEIINSPNRKIKIDHQIEELEKEKRHAVNKQDYATAGNYNRKIKQLKDDKYIDYVAKYLSEVEDCKKELVNIIFDYYKNGNNIHDIIKLENISQSVSNNWINNYNFGEKTGFLFVEDSGHQYPNWYYANPITDIKVNSSNLDDLKFNLEQKDEVLLIFNENLANKSYDKDLIIYEKYINDKLDNLRNFKYTDVEDTFTYLKNKANKFNNEQIKLLCEIMIKDSLLNSYAADFNYILDINKDKIDQSYIDKVYTRIIDKILLKFHPNQNINDIFIELGGYVDKITERQVRLLCSKIIENIDYLILTKDFFHIYDPIKNKYDNINFNHFEIIICIQYYLNELKNFYYDYMEYKPILKFLRKHASYFTKNQIDNFCRIIFSKSLGYGHPLCIDCITFILNINESKVDEYLYNRALKKISY